MQPAWLLGRPLARNTNLLKGSRGQTQQMTFKVQRKVAN